jgi:uncharacterized protein (DUF1697 family)
MPPMKRDIYVALLRGINVGGHRSIKMAELTALFGEQGYAGARTYLQSGNVVFASARVERHALERRLESALEQRLGYDVDVFVRSVSEWDRLIEENPFEVEVNDPLKVHLFVLREPPTAASLDALEVKRASLSEKGAEDRFVCRGLALYLHTPSGFGKSRLAQSIERTIGVKATARNWRTALALRELGASTRAALA